MRRRDSKLAQQLLNSIEAAEEAGQPLPGIQDPVARQVLLEQLLESIHRVSYISVIRKRDISSKRADPNNSLFDPLKAAILKQRAGALDEAFWLVFLFVHFGKHPRAGYRYAREVYGRVNDEGLWDWASVSTDVPGFRSWLAANKAYLIRNSLPKGFGNHRKYESLNADSATGTGAVVESYVKWVAASGNHENLVDAALHHAGGNAHAAFDHLYKSMASVSRFGRMARFDYLTMVGKLGLAPIVPGSAYIQSSTGPLAGARLLFAGDKDADISATRLDLLLVVLGAHLGVGMQVLEDALCNWQKSPSRFKQFRG